PRVIVAEATIRSRPARGIPEGRQRWEDRSERIHWHLPSAADGFSLWVSAAVPPGCVKVELPSAVRPPLLHGRAVLALWIAARWMAAHDHSARGRSPHQHRQKVSTSR